MDIRTKNEIRAELVTLMKPNAIDPELLELTADLLATELAEMAHPNEAACRIAELNELGTPDLTLRF